MEEDPTISQTKDELLQKVNLLQETVNRHSLMITNLYSVIEQINSQLSKLTSLKQETPPTSPNSLTSTISSSLLLKTSYLSQLEIDSPKTHQIKTLNDRNKALVSHNKALESLIGLYENVPDNTQN